MGATFTIVERGYALASSDHYMLWYRPPSFHGQEPKDGITHDNSKWFVSKYLLKVSAPSPGHLPRFLVMGVAPHLVVTGGKCIPTLLNCACTWMAPFHRQNLMKKLEL